MSQIDLTLDTVSGDLTLEVLSSVVDGVTLNAAVAQQRGLRNGPPSNALTLSSGGLAHLIANDGVVEIPANVGLFCKRYIKMCDEGWIGLEFNAGRIELHDEAQDLILLRNCNVGVGTEFDPDGVPAVRPDGIFEVRGTDDQDNTDVVFTRNGAVQLDACSLRVWLRQYSSVTGTYKGFGPTLLFARSGDTSTIGGTTNFVETVDGTKLGDIAYEGVGSNESEWADGAAIRVYQVGAATADKVPTKMELHTRDTDGSANDWQVTLAPDGNVGILVRYPSTRLDVNGAITVRELSSEPDDPDEGAAVLWMSDGHGPTGDGDILMKITANGSTKTTTLVDFSGV